MAKIDYAFKAEVLSQYQDILKLQREHSFLHYLQNYTREEIDIDYSKAVSQTVFSILSDEDLQKVWQEAEKINLAYYARVKRLKNRISDMLLGGTCFFLTLTFTDDILAKTSPQTRRKYVTLFLRSVSDTYTANIDFGSQNGREHYHAVILADEVDMSAWDCYGFSNAKKIASENDYKRIAKYISKLTNHAVKATTKGTKAIYSR